MNRQLEAMIKKQTGLTIELQGLLEFEMNQKKTKTKAITEAANALRQSADTLHMLHMIQVEDGINDIPFITSAFEAKSTYEEYNPSVSKSLEKAIEWDNIRFMSDEEYRQYRKDNL